MEWNQPEASAASGGVVAPKSALDAQERAPFSALRAEMIAALLMYPLAYLYFETYRLLLADATAALPRVLLAVFTFGFVAVTAYLHRETPRPRESFVWLGCVAALLASVAFERGRAWDAGLPFAFLHIFAVWWALSRSGALLEGESGRLLPLDALDGFVVFPFRHFFLRIRTMGFAVRQARGEKAPKKSEEGSLAWTLVIAAAAIGLLALATGLLMGADSGFAVLVDAFFGYFHFDWDMEAFLEFVFKLLLSLPIGAYLYGLIAGTRREDKDALRRGAANVDGVLDALRGVREAVWLALLALFCVLYALFFAVQGRYLFGAFTRTLPEGFIVSEYARQGFFELCKVMAVNFALLWLVARTSKKGVRARRALLTLCLVLLAESLLLAVVAFSKLALYIDCFGFTPKRLQSTWLVCVLAFGTLCAAWSLVKGQKTFRAWMTFGAVTLSLLCLY